MITSAQGALVSDSSATNLAAVTADAFEHLITNALEVGANTIHLEPHRDAARVRYRVDGFLQECGQCSIHALSALLTHIKHTASLDHTARWPQEGTATITVNRKTYTVKVNTLPLAHGEKAVLRVYNAAASVHELAELGLWGESKRRLTRTLAVHSGLILLSSPHQGGASTTLRSLSHLLTHPTTNVTSIEEHIEHRLAHVHQIRVNHHRRMGYTDALQAALQSDADVIVAHDIHTRSALASCIQAATRGRLVIGSTHARGTGDTLSRLTALTDESHMVGAHLQAVVHQRLARRLCNHCKEPVKPDLHFLQTLTATAGVTLATLQHFIKETRRHNSQIDRVQLYQARGCPQCRFTGYRGQIGLFEVLPISPTVRRTLNAQADSQILLRQATKEGMLPLKVDGLIKALCGLTSLQEVVRIAK